jgi:hypothetical protein
LWGNNSLSQDEIQNFHNQCKAVAEQRKVGNSSDVEKECWELSGDERDEEPWNCSDGEEGEWHDGEAGNKGKNLEVL